ncbi:MAG: AAA family ATPase [Alphaproteobacteria bacterium]|nr:AAA family ATPase [Alphaproteobacteria bacterium]
MFDSQNDTNKKYDFQSGASNKSESLNNGKHVSPIVSFMPPKPVVLVGLMGSGKTSIGKRLAKRFDLPFCDSDQEVEDAAGCAIGDIDSVFGEGALQEGELKVISRLINQCVQIIATGCLSFTYEDTRRYIKEHAISVWLKGDLETLLLRVTGKKDRPLLEAGKEKEILEKMIDDYYPLLEESDVTVTTLDEPAGITVDRVIIAISDFIKSTYPDYHILRSV